jgi:pyruvate formate lyase activating enzyme
VIAGLVSCSFIDYPGHLAAVLFAQGCNLHCPYCHNPDLIPQVANGVSIDAIESFLRNRRGRISGVVITGGEPTLHAELFDLIRRVRKLGFCVKLDTNGTQPAVLQDLLSQNLLDYVALDVKDLPEHYGDWLGPAGVGAMLQKSISILRLSSVAHEYRTTIVAGRHRLESLVELHRLIADDSPWLIQPAICGKALARNEFWSPISDAQTRIIIAGLGQLGITNVHLRGGTSGARFVA